MPGIDALHFTGRRGPCQAAGTLLRSGAVTEHVPPVIIGGGVGGASIAYHLTVKGWRDIVLVERAELTSGSTFHSAGLVGQLRSSVALTRLMMWSVECYRRLAAETGRDPGWKETGSLRLACTPDRVLEHRRQEGWAKTFGLPLEEIWAGGGARLFPVMAPDGVLGAVYLPTDGHLDPSSLAMALADGARQRGAKIGPAPGPPHRRAGRPRPRRRDHGRDDSRRRRGERGRHVRARRSDAWRA